MNAQTQRLIRKLANVPTATNSKSCLLSTTTTEVTINTIIQRWHSYNYYLIAVTEHSNSDITRLATNLYRYSRTTSDHIDTVNNACKHVKTNVNRIPHVITDTAPHDVLDDQNYLIPTRDVSNFGNYHYHMHDLSWLINNHDTITDKNGKQMTLYKVIKTKLSHESNSLDHLLIVNWFASELTDNQITNLYDYAINETVKHLTKYVKSYINLDTAVKYPDLFTGAVKTIAALSTYKLRTTQLSLFERYHAVASLMLAWNNGAKNFNANLLHSSDIIKLDIEKYCKLMMSKQLFTYIEYTNAQLARLSSNGAYTIISQKDILQARNNWLIADNIHKECEAARHLENDKVV